MGLKEKWGLNKRKDYLRWMGWELNRVLYNGSDSFTS